MEENGQNFTVGSIPKKMLGFMGPVLAALVLQAMYGAVDLMVVGLFGTTEGISGVTTGSGILNLVTFPMCALTTGVTVVMGWYQGEGTPEKLPKLLGSAICFFAVAALGLSGLMVALARPIAILMQAPAEALESTVTYIRICGGGYIFIVFYNFISSVFRGVGNAKLPLLFVGIACAVNIVGDLVLVAGFGMNTAGAAIATVGAQAVSVLLSVRIIRRKKLLSVTIRDLHFSGEIRRFWDVGAPLALQDLLTNLSFLALCAFINRLGLEASSGYGVGQKIQSFVMLLPSAIMQSMAAIVSQNVGARQEKRARHAMLWGMGIGGAAGIVIMYVVFFHGDFLAGFFTEDPAVIARAWEYLRGFAPEAVLTSVLFSFMGYFNGHSRSLFVMLQGVAQSFMVRLPMSYLMSIRPNASLVGIGLAAPTATAFGTLLCLWYYGKMRREMKHSLRSISV